MQPHARPRIASIIHIWFLFPSTREMLFEIPSCWLFSSSALPASVLDTRSIEPRAYPDYFASRLGNEWRGMAEPPLMRDR